jgi:mitogen-activated protein kinase kinase kinase
MLHCTLPNIFSYIFSGNYSGSIACIARLSHFLQLTMAAANTVHPPSSSSAASTPTSPVTFAHQQNYVTLPSNRRQSVRPGARTDASPPTANGIGGSPLSPNILDPPPGLSYAEFVAQWHDPHIARWLTDNKCAQYIQAFKDNDIRGDIILELDMDTLKEIGLVSVGDRTRIRNAIKQLRQRCQRPSAGPKLLLNGSPSDVKVSMSAGLKLNGDVANSVQETVEPYPTAARSQRRLESVRPAPIQIENVRQRDLPRLERSDGSNTQGPDSARPLATPRIAQQHPLGVVSRVSNTHGAPSIPPASKGAPAITPGGSKTAPRLQVPTSGHRGARTPTQESAPPPAYTSDPLPPQPAPPVSPWSKDIYGLPRSITPGNISGGSFAPRGTSPNLRGVAGLRSPGGALTHQKQSSFGNTPPIVNPLKLSGPRPGGGAAGSHPYTTNASMGSHNVLTPVQENFGGATPTAPNAGYSVGRGPFIQRGQTTIATMTTASDDFRRKTLKFHLRDSGSRMIEVKDFDGGSEILERALKKFNVKVNTSDSEYADVDWLHVDGWSVYLGSDMDRAFLLFTQPRLFSLVSG